MVTHANGEAAPYRFMTRFIRVAVVTLFAAFGLSAHAEEPVALVVSIDRLSEPVTVTPFTELRNGDIVELEGNTRMVFVHYQRCEEVTVESGELQIRSGSYRLVGGRIVSRNARGCPETGVSRTTHGVGGVVFRGPDGPTVSSKGRLILTGHGAVEVAEARVHVPDRQSRVSLDASDGTVDLRQLKYPVRAGDRLDLQLVGSSGQSVADYVVSIGRDTDRFAILRVD